MRALALQVARLNSELGYLRSRVPRYAVKYVTGPPHALAQLIEGAEYRRSRGWRFAPVIRGGYIKASGSSSPGEAARPGSYAPLPPMGVPGHAPTASQTRSREIFEGLSAGAREGKKPKAPEGVTK